MHCRYVLQSDMIIVADYKPHQMRQILTRILKATNTTPDQNEGRQTWKQTLPSQRNMTSHPLSMRVPLQIWMLMTGNGLAVILTHWRLATLVCPKKPSVSTPFNLVQMMSLSHNLILRSAPHAQLLPWQWAPKQTNTFQHLKWKEAWNYLKPHISHVLTVCVMQNGQHGMVPRLLHATHHGPPIRDKWPVHIKYSVYHI